jgi:hypothetical protein
MTPLINYIVKVAKLSGCQPDDIENFKNTCQKELDANFYTNEKAITSAAKLMLGKVKSKYEFNGYLL